jgi:hypothetical protein
MDLLLVAAVPFVGAAVMLGVALMSLPTGARLSMAAGAARDSRQLRELELALLSDDAAIDSLDEWRHAA